jgi:hypothetical protein
LWQNWQVGKSAGSDEWEQEASVVVDGKEPEEPEPRL